MYSSLIISRIPPIKTVSTWYIALSLIIHHLRLHMDVELYNIGDSPVQNMVDVLEAH